MCVNLKKNNNNNNNNKNYYTHNISNRNIELCVYVQC